MADFLADEVFDNGLTHLVDNTDRLVACSAQPANYAGVAAVTLGAKSSPTVGAPADRTGGGRKVTISAFSDGSVSASGDAEFFALVDDTNSVLLAAGDLNSVVALTSGEPFALTAFDIGIPDPA